MGQGEIIKVLEESDIPLSRSQIAEELDYNPIVVSKLLVKLMKANEVKCIEHDRFKSAKLLNKNACRRMRFYYVNL